MSGYPYGHGQWPPPQQQGQPQQAPPHQHFAQYGYQPSSNPSAPYGSHPYQAPPQTQPPLNYSGDAPAAQASHAAYKHNAQVSGLGIAMEAPGERGPNAVGGDLSWSEAFPTSAAASALPSAYPPYNAPSHSPYPQQQRYQHQYPSQPAPPPQAPQQAVYSPPAFQAASDANDAYNPEAAVVVRGEPEQGELSEDMDDPYEPEETSGSTGNGDPTAFRSPASRDVPADDDFAQVAMGQAAADLPSRDASVIDTQDDGFYDEDDDEEPGEIKSNENSASASDAADADDEDMGYSDSEPKSAPAAGEERAGSYSPRLSPRLSPGEIDESDDAARAPRPTISAAAVAAVAALASTEITYSKDMTSITNGSTDAASRGPSAALEESQPTPGKLPYTSVDDAKKEAQRAILRLIPYGVHYQTYIDEGFDEKLIKPLFSELGLKAAPTESTPVPRSASPALLSEPAASVPEPPGDDAAPKEERKDRIARLLALKASKTAPAHVAKVPVFAPPAKPEKTKSEKAILLQQRLEALKQAQGQRAAAASKTAAEATALGESVSGQHGEVAAAIVETIADKAAAIAAALPPTPPVNPRQRPVAADFADFSSGAATQSSHNPLKRPYELTRQGSSMVIEVSDDSADEDVAMELDSQADEPASRTGEPAAVQDGRAALYRDEPYGNRNGNRYNDRGHPSQMDGPSAPARPGYGGRASRMMPAPPTAPSGMVAQFRDDEYTKKMREIELMKRKIAEAEARNARASSAGSRTPQASGQQTPSDQDNNGNTNNGSSVGNGDLSSLVVRPPPQPFRRIMSTGELSREEGVGSPLAVSDAPAAQVPKRPDASSRSSSHDSHREKRIRVASLQLPRVEASLQEKMFKLRLLQDKVAALQAEIDAGVAEKQRLTEDMEDLAKEPEEDTSEREMSAPLPPPEAQAIAVPTEEAEQANGAASPCVPLQAGGAQTVASEQVPDKEVEADATAEVAVEADVGGEVSQADDSKSVAGSVAMSDASSPYELASDVDVDGDLEMVDDEAGEEEEEEEEEEDSSGEAEEGEADNAEAVDELFHGEAQPKPRQGEHVVPVAKAAPTGVKAGTLSSVFVPYESPLQYFRSFRYHPQYKARVPGGYRSLTYSGKIQDDVELCSTEMAGENCTDAACSFQHFATIVPQDDQILVELGRADDYTGERKAQFVDGLTSLLKTIRDNKVRDFDTIAESIIDFRRSFLGDGTRVISHLDGVTV